MISIILVGLGAHSPKHHLFQDLYFSIKIPMNLAFILMTELILKSVLTVTCHDYPQFSIPGVRPHIPTVYAMLVKKPNTTSGSPITLFKCFRDFPGTMPFSTLQQPWLWRLYNFINALQQKEQDGEEISCTAFCSGDLLSYKHWWIFLSPNRRTFFVATAHKSTQQRKKKKKKIK